MSSSSTPDSIERAIWDAVEVLAELPDAPSQGHGLEELGQVFDAIRHGEGPDRNAAESRAWEIWCDHPDAGLAEAMERGIGLLSSGDLGRAEAAFDDLTERAPDWAETWNKRATVYYLQGRDAESVRDILRTLALEPRHFGALGGLAQICMRNESPDGTAAALERMQHITPGDLGLARALDALAARHAKTLH